MQLAFLTILPSIFFSGYIFPRETMPRFFYALSYFVPASVFHQHYARRDSARGRMVHHLWTGCIGAFRHGTFLLVIAARRFQNKVIMA